MEIETDPNADTQIELEKVETETEPEAEALAETEEGKEPEGELVVTIGDDLPEEAKQPAPAWVKDLRRDHRKLAKENRELRQRLESTGQKLDEEDPGKEPEMDDPEIDFDSGKFKAVYKQWTDKKAAIAERKRKATESQSVEQQQWTQTLASHKERAAKLKVADYDEAEDAVFTALDQTQQGCLIQVSGKSELLVLALGRDSAKLQSLAAIKDPAKFIYELAKLETQLKTTTRRPATQPEGRVEQRSAGKPKTSEAGLEKLRAEAVRTGDYSKVTAYRNQMRAAK